MKLFAFFFALLISTHSFADLSSQEWGALVGAGVKSMMGFTEQHNRAVRETGVGLLYGWQSRYSKLSETGKKKYIRQVKRSGTNPRMPEITSCVHYVMRHLRVAYYAAGLGGRWEEIARVMQSHDQDGLYLMQELQKDGWEAVYWNPDVKNPVDGKYDHTWTYLQASRGRGYYGTKVDHYMINYIPTTRATKADRSGLAKLRKVPFWVGVANGAYHVFLGHNGNVNESHSPYDPEDRRNIEDYDFFRGYFGFGNVKYLSGLIMVPPGTWPRD